MLKKMHVFVILLFLAFSAALWAEDEKDKATKETTNTEEAQASEQKETDEKSIEELETSRQETLLSIIKVQRQLKKEIKELSGEIKRNTPPNERTKLNSEINQLEEQLSAVDDNFEKIATGIDIHVADTQKEQAFSFQENLNFLLEPIISEMKHMTAKVRQKADLRDEIEFYQENLPHAYVAVENVNALLKEAKNKGLKKELKELRAKWQRHVTQMLSGLNSAQYQLQKMEAEEVSFTEASHSYLKSFFQERGLYLTMGFSTFFGVLLFSHFFYKLLTLIPNFRQTRRSFRVRLIDLLYRVFFFALATVSPMFVFYIVEDWVLFSFGLLFLIGLVWTLRHTVPRFWEQARLMLNIGAVREGERVMVNNLPWRVKYINVFCHLHNPRSGLRLRLPVGDLVGLVSRPEIASEPWFPCQKDDWVILDDGVRGKVVGLSNELIELVERGGAHKTYLIDTFLKLSPRNLSMNFRIKSTLGITYDLQQESTTKILEKLERYLLSQVIKEGLKEDVLNIRVEFQSANASSLDLVVLADFRGKVAPLYNRMRRALQRWCVDACSEHDWEIPFQQVTLHTPEKLQLGGRQ